MNNENIKYVIARKYHSDKNSYDFIATLSHHFAGEDEVIGYLPLNNCLHFETKEEAEKTFLTQPKWVKEKHIVIPFNNYYGDAFLIRD